MRRNLAVIVDCFRDILAHQLAYFADGRVRRIDRFQLQAQGIELNAKLVHHLHRGCGQGGTLCLQPQFGAADHLSRVTLVEIRAFGHFHPGKVRQHTNRNQRGEDSQHDAGKADSVDDQPGYDGCGPDCAKCDQDAAELLFPICLFERCRSLANRRAAMHPAIALQRERFACRLQDSIGFTRAVGHGACAFSYPAPAAMVLKRPWLEPVPGLRRARYSPWTFQPRPTALRPSASCWRAP